MKLQRSNLILIVFVVLLIVLLLRMFTLGSNLTAVQSKLEVAEHKLDSISAKLSSADEKLKLLRSNIRNTAIEHDQLKSERDSLIKSYLSKLRKNENELSKLKQQETAFKLKVGELRREHELFE